MSIHHLSVLFLLVPYQVPKYYVLLSSVKNLLQCYQAFCYNYYETRKAELFYLQLLNVF